MYTNHGVFGEAWRTEYQKAKHITLEKVLTFAVKHVLHTDL